MNQEELLEINVMQSALDSGFMISTQFGQEEPKLMPTSDKATLVKFAKSILKEYIHRDDVNKIIKSKEVEAFNEGCSHEANLNH